MKKILWIKVTEKVSRNIGLTIGETITQEEAEKLLKLVENDDEFEHGTEEYDLINTYVHDYVVDTEGYENVNIYIQNRKENEEN